MINIETFFLGIESKLYKDNDSKKIEIKSYQKLIEGLIAEPKSQFNFIKKALSLPKFFFIVEYLDNFNIDWQAKLDGNNFLASTNIEGAFYYMNSKKPDAKELEDFEKTVNIVNFLKSKNLNLFEKNKAEETAFYNLLKNSCNGILYENYLYGANFVFKHIEEFDIATPIYKNLNLLEAGKSLHIFGLKFIDPQLYSFFESTMIKQKVDKKNTFKLKVL